MWAETGCSFANSTLYLNFNPLRPCGRRPKPSITAYVADLISIHSARVGGDNLSYAAFPMAVGFQSTPPVWAETVQCHHLPKGRTISIHSARVGGDVGAVSRQRRHIIFQSTPPVWAETFARRKKCVYPRHFNPLRPCGRRLPSTRFNFCLPLFQSTPPVWAETRAKSPSLKQKLFQSTPPVWAETISVSFDKLHIIYFNPLCPCGRRRQNSPSNRKT